MCVAEPLSLLWTALKQGDDSQLPSTLSWSSHSQRSGRKMTIWGWEVDPDNGGLGQIFLDSPAWFPGNIFGFDTPLLPTLKISNNCPWEGDEVRKQMGAWGLGGLGARGHCGEWWEAKTGPWEGRRRRRKWENANQMLALGTVKKNRLSLGAWSGVPFRRAGRAGTDVWRKERRGWGEK
jgi:hypothetical protein